ncbi:MAG: GNAT family N-acetyltransferase [Negativicutes bacterium]|nr:GNAT family N-acetyltransferase [Negativicutes bacterium]
MCDIKLKYFNYNKKSIIEQRELFKNAFPERIGTEVAEESHYFWKFHTFPFMPNSYEYSAYRDNKMVGYYAALPYKYVINGKEMICGMICDVMTHSSMRGQNIFTKIGGYATDDLKDKGLHFTSGYPIRPEVIPGHLKVGWKKLFKMPLYIKVLKINAILSKFNIPFGSVIINPFIKVMSLYKIFCSNCGNESEIYDVHEINKITGYEEFFVKWSSTQVNYLIKSREFLKWRLSAPGKKYQIICVRKEGNINAMAIITFANVKGIPSIGVLDLMVLDENYSAIKYLFRTLEKLALERKAEVIIGMFCKHLARKYNLIKYGMIKTNIFFTLILKQLDSNIDFEDLKKEINWNLTWIDSDNL